MSASPFSALCWRGQGRLFALSVSTPSQEFANPSHETLMIVKLQLPDSSASLHLPPSSFMQINNKNVQSSQDCTMWCLSGATGRDLCAPRGGSVRRMTGDPRLEALSLILQEPSSHLRGIQSMREGRKRERQGFLTISPWNFTGNQIWFP